MSIVKIDHLVLRVPGLSEREARLLGEKVAQRVSQRIPPAVRARRIDSLDLWTKLPPGASTEQLARIIADAIVERL